MRTQAHQVVFKAKDNFSQNEGAAAFKVLRFHVRELSGLFGENARASTPLRVFPNPTTTGFHLDFGEIMTQQAMLSLCDLRGNLQFVENLPPGISAWSLDLTALPQGPYLFVIRGADGKVWRGKVIKQ